MELIGKREGDPAIAAFLGNLGASDGGIPLPSRCAFPALKSRPACEYHNYEALGVSLCFEESALEAVHVYNGTHGYSQFIGDLPHGLRIGMTGREIVELLGEPDGKAGGGRGGGPISIAYKERGLHINFLGSSWENSDSAIDSVTIHAPQPQTMAIEDH
ncbi:hypothetical protein SELMODRAFT_412979 [Selaginella moellendorffii]|uniref:Uncharacterized protein n=1 Tax=Selaginella moellendorffii TaxID=88036 RepID=D8RMY8_SELML|nr:uncharacterized protein LOC9651352 [Selaginella moellendorffii]EFJ26418.1 hypothetical protein SELMODRAFT_412979 [Selaginella moellendorffii]|eukprot:XP_002972332.1 uncharacterized protein LOC9651352 [Selaginella moellendorffii]